MYKRH